MAIHLTRDFLSHTNAVSPLANMHYLACFCIGVLGFTVVGSKNSSSWPLALGTTSGGLIGSGSVASINTLGAGKENYVRIEPGEHTVSSSHHTKILTLRSNLNPRLNSGLYRILSSSVDDNAYIVDYRASSFPTSESGSMSWVLFQSESLGSHSESVFSDNGTAGDAYRTTGSATYPRIILQSPAGWQVRICAESYADRWTVGGHNVGNTISVGLDGNSSGDWLPAARHTHGLSYWNDNNTNRRSGQQGGIDPLLGATSTWATGQWRTYMWGDDQTGTVVFLNRNVSIGGGGMCMFGMPENEQSPVPADIAHRIFTVGDSLQGSLGNGQSWNIATKNDYSFTGQAFGYSGQPISCVFSSYHFATSNTRPRDQVTQDNPVFKATELVPVELRAGTWRTQYSRGNPTQQDMFLEPRRMGIVPMARQGRSNFANWSVSSDPDRTWIHTSDGMYLPWSASIPLP